MGSRRRWTRWGLAAEFVPLVAVATLLALLPLASGPLTSTSATNPTAGGVTLAVPNAVAVGQRVLADIVVAGVGAVTASEATLAFDPSAVVFGGRHDGTGQTSLGAVESPHGLEIGTLGSGTPGPGGTILTTVELAFTRPGLVHLAVRDVTIATPDGQALRLPPVTTTVEVGRSGRVIPAPAAPSRRAAGATSVPALHALDRTGDGVIGDGDVADQAYDWITAREAGAVCGASPRGVDLTADGCVDVVDVSAVALRRGAAIGSPGPGQVEVDGAARAIRLASHGTATYVVNSTSDAGDASTSDGVCRTWSDTCTLRAALQQANAHAGPDRITFNIAGSGPHTIAPQTKLPTLTDSETTIDGYTQPGSTENTLGAGSNADIRIQVVGTGPSGIDGFFVAGADNVIQGLAIYNFKRAVWFWGVDSLRNQVRGSFLGTNAAGTFRTTQVVSGASCVVAQTGAKHNRTGTEGNQHRNVISGCSQHGVAMYDTGTQFNLVYNNVVGLNPAGTNRLANGSHGVDINTGAADNTIGGTASGQRNVVSGNLQTAIEVSHGRGTQRNHVIGNFVGTALDGASAPAYARNDQFNVRLEGLATCSSTCGEDAGNSTVADNVVVGGGRGGIFVDKGFNRATIRGNRVGLTTTGASAPNSGFGIRIEGGAFLNTIGPSNNVANNPAGIQINPRPTTPPSDVDSPTNQNRITRNTMNNNGTPSIDLAPLWQANTPGVGNPNANAAQPVPRMRRPTASYVDVDTCGGCTVEAFTSPRPDGYYGPGVNFVGSAVANSSGVARVFLSAAAQGQRITATATSASGNTSEFGPNVSVPTGSSSNTAPTARATASCSSLVCTFDGSGSTDSDGTIDRHRWIFPDGEEIDGVQVERSFPEPGSYTVQLVVTDDQGAEDTDAVTASPTVAAGTLLDDRYTRTSTSGWGTADFGGSWTQPSWHSSSFSVDGTRGRVAITSAGMSRQTTVTSIDATDVDMAATVATDENATGSWGQTASLVARQNNTSEYWGRLRFAPDGRVHIGFVKVVGSSAPTVGGEVAVPGLSRSAGDAFRVRLRVTGTSPTTLQAKVWRAGTTEPSGWHVTASDSEASLQGSGAAGFHAYVSGSSTAPVSFFVDDFLIASA